MSPLPPIKPMPSWGANIPPEDLPGHVANLKAAPIPEWHDHIPEELKFLPKLIDDIHNAASDVHKECIGLLEAIAVNLESADASVNVDRIVDAISTTEDALDWLESAFALARTDYWLRALPTTKDCVIIRIIDMGRTILSGIDRTFGTSRDPSLVGPRLESLRLESSALAWRNWMETVLKDRRQTEISLEIEVANADGFIKVQMEKLARDAMAAQQKLQERVLPQLPEVSFSGSIQEIPDDDGPYPDYKLKLGSDLFQINKKSRQCWMLLNIFWKVKDGDSILVQNLVGSNKPWDSIPAESSITSTLNRFKNEMPSALPWCLKKDHYEIRKVSKSK